MDTFYSTFPPSVFGRFAVRAGYLLGPQSFGGFSNPAEEAGFLRLGIGHKLVQIPLLHLGTTIGFNSKDFNCFVLYLSVFFIFYTFVQEQVKE